MIILSAILLTAALVTWVHFSYLRSERLDLIDNQIRGSASVLINSDLTDLAKINFTSAEAIIAEELGPSRIGKLFIIRNNQGQIIFSSETAQMLSTPIPREPQWVTLETKGQFIRVLNLNLPSRPDRTLQVGVVVDAEFFKWSTVSDRVIGYVAVVILIAMFTSGLLASVLLQPFNRLNSHLAAATRDLKNMRDVQGLPRDMVQHASGFWSKADEFSALVINIQRLLEKINQNYRLIKVWAMRMAHEMKTPLTVLRSDLEILVRDLNLTKDKTGRLLEGVDSTSAIVTEFLDWAELEQSTVQTKIHAVRLRDLIFSVREKFDRLAPGRIRLQVIDDTTAFAFPPHVEQLISNLVSNALKYSPPGQPIDIGLNLGVLRVMDHGEGIAADVLERLGQPFNKGINSYQSRQSSSGLGLAIVSSIVRLYGWDLDLKSDPQGTAVQVNFHFDA
ncbi:MAG: sensor histidine kinase [Bdellovibrionales bacterium]